MFIGTITSANAVFMLSVASVVTSPVQIQGFSMDDIFDAENPDSAEIQMGADGLIAAGYLPTLNPMNVMLQASSPSNAVFEAWDTAEQQAIAKYYASATIALAGINRTFTLSNGVLKSPSRIPAAGKVLKPRRWGLVWGSIVPSPTA